MRSNDDHRGPGATAQAARVGAADGETTGPLLTFHQVPEGKTVKNRLHLDLGTAELAAETERLTGLGAKRLWELERGDLHWITFADPEGSEFDLIER